MAGYNVNAATARHFFDGQGQERSGFKVFHEISAANDFAGKYCSLPVLAMPSARPASADRTDELSNFPDRAKSRNPRQSGTSSDSCSEPYKQGHIDDQHLPRFHNASRFISPY